MVDTLDDADGKQSRRNFRALRLLKAFTTIDNEAKQAFIVDLVERYAADAGVSRPGDGSADPGGGNPQPETN